LNFILDPENSRLKEGFELEVPIYFSRKGYHFRIKYMHLKDPHANWGYRKKLLPNRAYIIAMSEEQLALLPPKIENFQQIKKAALPRI